jgi:hypothetical protein
MMMAMDRFEGRCWLDWRANSSTTFGGFEISVVITPTGSGWDARGELLASDDERELFTFLCDMDPVFTLRFHDSSTVQVTLTPTGDRRCTLSEQTGPASRQVGHNTGS